MLEKILKSILFAGALVLGCGDDSYVDINPVTPPVTYTREETNKNKIMNEGVNLTSWGSEDYFSPEVDNTLEYLHDEGVESVSFLTTYYQDTADSTIIYEHDTKTPTDESLENVISKAKSLGMRTVLKPHVDCWNGDWRGYISFSNETDWTNWFNSYNNFITHYAQLAEDKGVDCLILGTELVGTTDRAEWDVIINNVRSIYFGELTYGANHDNYKNVPFWDKLDFIGVDAYFPLTNVSNPTLSDLVDAWGIIAQDMNTFSQLVGKEIMITEVGYQSVDGTNMTPWWTTGAVDEQEQADCYEAMYSALFNQSFIHEISPWMCYYDPWQDIDRFDFAGKLSGDVLYSYYYE